MKAVKSVLRNLAVLITAIATIAVISMDLGTPYSKSELKLYTNKVFITVVALAVAYTATGESATLSMAAVGVWWTTKYMLRAKDGESTFVRSTTEQPSTD